ncbi:hypothetical protein F4810DRAFT_722721 [Camillea tinctor]|nr:hypothetical protein F4810DRAFT_722721 [Camillea tinctor]
MKLTKLPLFILISVLSLQSAASISLNFTAIGAHDGSSTLECWQMEAPFDVSASSGTVGEATAKLGNVANITYGVLPPSVPGALHNAPHNQWVMIIRGTARITLPGETTYAHLVGGPYALIFAADTADVSVRGHHTEWNSMTETIFLQIPTADGKVPPHVVLHKGPCGIKEVTGIRDLAMGMEARRTEGGLGFQNQEPVRDSRHNEL